MGESERRQFLDTLHQDGEFRTDVRRELLMQEFLTLPQTVSLLSAAVNGLIDQQAEMQRELTSLRSDVDALVTMTRQLFEIVVSGFTEMRQEFAAVRSDMQSGDAEVRSEMQSGFASIDARFDRLELRFRDNGNPPAS